MRAKDYRKQAWNTLKGHWKPAVITGVIATVLGGNIATMGSASSSSTDTDALTELANANPEMIATILIGLLVPALIFGLISLFIGGSVSLGYARFNLDLMDGRELRTKTLFSQFSRFGTGMAMRFLTGLFVFLWSLLFIVPGVIAGLGYAMTPYVLAENPDMGAREAMKVSKDMMKGHKWRLFCLEISFFGWYLLGAVTLGIANLFVVPYAEAAVATFYREISGTGIVTDVESVM